jgi:hypothetical protein
VSAEAVVNGSEEQLPCVHPGGRAERSIQVDREVEHLRCERSTFGDPCMQLPLEDLEQRRDADHRRDPSRLEAVLEALARELVEIDDAGPPRERQEQAARQLERVMQGQDTENAVVPAERKKRRQRSREGGQVFVAEHDALGGPRRAARVDQNGHVPGLGGRGQRGGPGRCRRPQIQEGHRRPERRTEPRLDRFVGDECLGSGRAHDVLRGEGIDG